MPQAQKSTAVEDPALCEAEGILCRLKVPHGFLALSGVLVPSGLSFSLGFLSTLTHRKSGNVAVLYESVRT